MLPRIQDLHVTESLAFSTRRGNSAPCGLDTSHWSRTIFKFGNGCELEAFSVSRGVTICPGSSRLLQDYLAPNSPLSPSVWHYHEGLGGRGRDGKWPVLWQFPLILAKDIIDTTLWHEALLLHRLEI